MPNQMQQTRIPWGIGLVGALAVVGSVVVGFVGAPGHGLFAWNLAAEIGTALGTILLAVYTASLASTTRAEVRLAISEQRARDRPVVVAVRSEIGGAPLDATIGLTVPTLNIDLWNVGLGPALDIEIEAHHLSSSQPVGRERVGVLSVEGGVEARQISLTGLDKVDELRVEDFRLTGRYTDRSRENPYEVVEVSEEGGLRDLQRKHERIAARRATLTFQQPQWLRAGPAHSVFSGAAMNIGLGAAQDVIVRIIASDRNQVQPQIELGEVASRRQTGFEFAVPTGIRDITYHATYTDGNGHQERDDGPWPLPPAARPA